MDVLSLIAKLTERTNKTANKYRQLGALNERYTSGQVFGAVSLSTNSVTPIISDDDWTVNLPRVWSQRISGLLQSWAALLAGDLPTSYARASTDDPVDAFRAEMANDVLQYLRQRLNTAEKIQQVVRFAGMHGTAGIKVTYDSAEEDVRWDVLTIYQYLRDPTQDYRDAKWCIIESRIDEEDAKARLKAAGIEATPSTQVYTNSLGEENEGVELIELYMKPCADYQEGIYASVVSGTVAQKMPYPYYFKVKGKRKDYLPVFLMKVRDQRDSPFGHTPVTELIPLQRGVNEALATKLLRIRMSAPSLILPKSIADNYKPTESVVISFDDSRTEMAKDIRWTQPPPLDQSLDGLIAMFENEMMAVIGLNDTSAGNAKRAQSGAAIDSLLALDKQKNADCSTSMKMMIMEAFRFSLLLVATFMPDDKKAEVCNQSMEALMLFSESDMDGLDVSLQIDSEQSDLELGKLRSTASGVQMQQARQKVADYMAGADVDPTDLRWLDPQALTRAVSEAKAIAKNAGNTQDWSALHQLEIEIAQQTPPSADQINPGVVGASNGT